MKFSETVADLEQQLFSLHPKAKELYTLINGLKAVDQPDEPFVYNVNFHNYVVHNLGNYKPGNYIIPVAKSNRHSHDRATIIAYQRRRF